MCLAVPGKIIRIDDDGPFSRAGKVDFGGVVREVNLALVPDASAGDYVLVHVGMAISKIDEEEAARVFEMLREMEELGEVEEFGERRKP